MCNLWENGRTWCRVSAVMGDKLGEIWEKIGVKIVEKCTEMC